LYDGDADDTSEPLPGTTNSKIIPGRSANVTTPVVGDLSVRTWLAESFRALDPATQSAFQRLISSDTSRVSPGTLRTELDIPDAAADRVLEALVHHHLLVPEDTARVHRIPELLCAYGRALRRRETAVVPVRGAPDTPCSCEPVKSGSSLRVSLAAVSGS
jgi:hypothetical protein